ncbi:hypothetical protein ZIOFF_017310 [Zingiber officinale]|uniref:C2H2-type domain-containing protein n=1 Tax=Zingiber officinale TaxID=94328 RepID=A0A8J5LA57_ZINOF|nr:hypothetical protein ZIOFF_017310 [Zingiber officinale]
MSSIFKHPAHVPMWRGAKVAYLLIAMCLFPIAIGGFWAYGNLVETRTLEELLEFSSQNRTSLTRIMLDNMVVPLPNGDVDVSMLKDAVQLVNDNSELTKEATDLFIWCLTQNAECYKQWEKLYVENVGATIIVLRKLSTEWLNYSAKISPDTLKVTLKHLRAKVSNLKQHIKAVHQNLRPFACRFYECWKKFPYKHVRDNHEKSGVHSYIQFTNLKYSRVEIDEVRFEWAECMLDYI